MTARGSRRAVPALEQTGLVLAVALLAAVLALAPLPFGGNRPAAWTLLAVATGAALLVWILTASSAPRRNLRVPLHAYAFPVGCFVLLLVWFLLQISPLTPAAWHHPNWPAAARVLQQPVEGRISADPLSAEAAILRFLTYGAVFFLSMQLAASRRMRRRLLLAIAVSGVAYAVYGLIIQFGGYDHILWYPRWSYHESLSATFVNRNSFATYAGLVLLVLIGLLWQRVAAAPHRGEGRAPNGKGQYLNDLAARAWPALIAIILVFMALLLTQSRGGLLACLLALPALPRYVGLRSRSTRLFGLGLAVLLVVVLLLGAGETWRRIDREGSQAALSRVEIYSAVVDGIAERPWLGHGYGSFESAFPQFRGPELLSAAVVDKAHNSYLEFAFEAGLPATGVMLLMLAAILRQCYRGIAHHRRAASPQRCAIAATVLVGSHALVDFSVQIPAVAILFAALLGIGVGAGYGAASTPAAGRGHTGRARPGAMPGRVSPDNSRSA